MPASERSRFPSTRRSIIEALLSEEESQRQRAFETVCAVYWRPLYKYLRVFKRQGREEAEDLTQSFFSRLLEKETLSEYDPAKASFRTFLRLLLDRYLANELKAAARLKRGGGETQLDFDAAELELGPESGSAGPEEFLQREWVRSVFTMAVEGLRSSLAASGHTLDLQLFEALDLSEEARPSYRELAERFAVPETTITNRLAAARRRFREAVLDTLREATASEREFRAEARALLGIQL